MNILKDINGKLLMNDDKKIYQLLTSRYYIGGGFTNDGIRISALNLDGTKDTTFDAGTSWENKGTVRAIGVQSDGKVIVGGTVGFNRYNFDGSIDTSFANNTLGIIRHLEVLEDDKILVGGNIDFIDWTGGQKQSFVKLNSDGTVDQDFTGFGSGPDVETFKRFNDKVILGFASYGVGHYLYHGMGILNMEPQGPEYTPATGFDYELFDSGFTSGFLSSDNIFAIEIVDDKILVGGNFSSYNGNTVGNIIRLNTDGSIDETFNSGTGFDNTVWCMKYRNGKIYIGGTFAYYNGTFSDSIIVLNTNGTIYQRISSGAVFTGQYDTVRQIEFIGDKFLVAGGFVIDYSYNTQIQRFNSDWTIDLTWTPSNPKLNSSIESLYQYNGFK